MKSALFIGCFLTVCGLLQAQLPQYHAQVFGAEQGIAGGNISSIFKDRQQFLWITEGKTLQRFDGRNTLDHPFEHIIMQAFCDETNRIWVLEGEKIWRSSLNRRGFEAVALDATAGQPCAIFQLKQGPVYLLTKRGFFYLEARSDVFQPWQTNFPPSHSIPAFNRFDTCGTTIFYPGENCFYAADLASGKLMTLEITTRFATFCAFSPDLAAISYYDGASYWLDFKKGIVKPADARHYGLSRQHSNLNIMDAVPIGDSLFLVTTKFGACTYDMRKDRFYCKPIFAEGRPIESGEAILRLFRDGNGTFWAHNSTNILAFNALENSIGLLRNYHNESLKRWSNRVVGFAEDVQGNIWFGGFNGFNKLNMTTGAVETHPPAEDDPKHLSHHSVRGLAFDGNNLVLGPTLRGMWLYNPEADRYFRPQWEPAVEHAMQQEFVNGILPLRDGNFLVCGAPSQYRLEKRTHRLESLTFSDQPITVSGACQDADGRIWLAGGAAVFVLDEQCKLLFRIPMGQSHARSVFVAQQDTMLVGTDNGLLLLCPASAAGKLSVIRSMMDGKVVNQICSDKRGRFWFGTTDGLFLADAALKVFRRFDFSDNIQSRFFSPFSMFRASNGLLFLGGYNGINFFYPENIEMEAAPLTVSIQTLIIGNNDSIIHYPGNGYVFSYNQNTISFDVTAPYYNNAGKLQYRYRLSPNEPWANTNGSALIRLTNLPSMSYSLEVAASVTGAIWYAAPPFEFRIKPPFWQTTLFRLVLGIGVFCVFWLFLKYRETVLKKRQQQVLELEKLKSAALQFEVEASAAKLQSLRLQMNPHFLFNALNSIQELILSGNNDGAASYLSKFSKLLRMVLAQSNHDWVSLQEEIDMLKLFLDLESLRFNDTFEYKIDCSLDPDQYQVPTLLIQPFVENAVWHGLLHKQGRRCLRLQFYPEADDKLCCEIEDNGVGRSVALHNAATQWHTGKGLSVGMQRIEALNSRYNQCNTLKIIDLFDDNGIPCGTRIVLTFS